MGEDIAGLASGCAEPPLPSRPGADRRRLRLVRSGPGADTDQASLPTFAEVWPETGARVQRFLRSRGLSASAAEDISQEVAERALRSQVAYTGVDDLARWAYTVAWRIRIDELRRPTVEDAPVPAERPSPIDVEGEVLSRARMTQVMSALAGMPARDRRVLLSTVMGNTAPLEAGHLAVARHRARIRLRRAMGEV